MLETRAAAKSVNDIIAEEVGKWRKSNGVMLVISRSAVIDGDWDSADYTKTILAAVNKRKAAFAALPAVNIVKEQAGKADTRKRNPPDLGRNNENGLAVPPVENIPGGAADRHVLRHRRDY